MQLMDLTWTVIVVACLAYTIPLACFAHSVAFEQYPETTSALLTWQLFQC